MKWVKEREHQGKEPWNQQKSGDVGQQAGLGCLERGIVSINSNEKNRTVSNLPRNWNHTTREYRVKNPTVGISQRNLHDQGGTHEGKENKNGRQNDQARLMWEWGGGVRKEENLREERE